MTVARASAGRGRPRRARAASSAALGLLLAAALGGCGDGSGALATQVEAYCDGFGPSLRLAARAARSGQRGSVGVGPIGHGTGAALNERMHFCAGARQGWGDPSAPPMTAAQDFADLSDRLDAMFVGDGEGEDAEVAGVLEEMAARADDVSEMPLR